ncbi:MAG: metal ABC transporter substrate-binding protein [Firmicutes bacterium]|nr:metal ABC transporter substrate-binding protein [Bacillota bacterium]
MKKTFKRISIVVLALLLAVPASLSLIGCNRRVPDIVVTIFPFYDWTRVILGENPNDLYVRYLLDTGVDLHNYQISFRDRADISTARLFLYNGGKSDVWTLNALINPQYQNRRAVPLMRELSLEETMVFPDENVISDEEECCGGATHDEHVWLSLQFAMRFVARIRDEIILLDPSNAEYYRQNAAAYIEKLAALDAELVQMTYDSPRDTILVADRFPFLYMASRPSLVERDGEMVQGHYNLFYFYSAFDGCSQATNVDFATRIELINAINYLALDVILIVDNVSLATSLINDSNFNPVIYQLECFQSVSRHHINNGLTYYYSMRQNLTSLKAALR